MKNIRSNFIHTTGYSALAALLAITIVLAGCSSTSGGNAQEGNQAAAGEAVNNSKNASEGAANEAKPEEPLELSIMTVTPSTPPAADDNVIKRAIEQATNSKMTIQWVSNNIYDDKLNITLASGEIPDLIMINDPFGSTFRTMASQGAFWDITDYVKDYPNLTGGIPDKAWESSKMADGRNYGIPRPRSVKEDSFFIIRKDWLDKLGLQQPTTTEELYQVMKAFVEQDPDGNGQKDTTALASYVSPSDASNSIGGLGPALGAIEASFTGVNGNWKWDEQQQKLVYTALLPEVRHSLEYLTNAYKEGLLPEDLLSLKLSQARDLFKGNKAGIIVDKTGTMKLIYASDLKKVVPTFKFTDFYPLTKINGYSPKGIGFNGLLAIPKSVPEEKLKRILGLVDTWMNKEVNDLQLYGLEGVHYKVENGKKVVDSDKLKQDNGSDFNQIVNVLRDDTLLDKAESQEEIDAILYAKKVEDERDATSIPNISAGLYSPSADLAGPDLDKRIQDLKAKIILGREPLSAWDDFVAKLGSDANLAKISQELTEAYLTREGAATQ
ncbi:putative aldouronate transport system substrate-binding protein [Paenibacillus phyllosphaerae]|uniref:Putative aldouronate transport system substrate-binding protein n=1 Tax=Paenibacillus phyllosphaerae TaxID=274593 RepID=A0A7W5FMF1_9BACL|nr:extracellular solute-binding protein [Paenibacillus phyllosphaerae]MBB3110201.1 putative aldouronate transport system substrate-binding protein [Paenibacillus phyllosphaerae]